VGAKDAEPVAEQVGGEMADNDLPHLPRYQAYVRLLIEAMPSRRLSKQRVSIAARSRRHAAYPRRMPTTADR